MHDIELGIGQLRQISGPASSFTLQLRRPGQRMVDRIRVAGRESLLHQIFNHVTVLGMNHN
ncbi:hypothetical protein D3C86_2114380 [compost metagenome]